MHSFQQDSRWDRWARNQDLPPSWRWVWRGWRLQRANSNPEGFFCCLDSFSESHSLQWIESLICRWATNLLLFSRLASRSRWWAPTSRLRPRGRRSGAACTPGEWWRWRTQSTTTSSSCGSCWCEWQRGSHSPQPSVADLRSSGRPKLCYCESKNNLVCMFACE